MTAFALDEFNDLAFDNDSGVFPMIDGDDAAAQKINISLNTNRAEISWNPEIGVNHYNILINSDDEDAIKDILTDYLTERFGNDFQSLSINSSVKDKANRILTIYATAIFEDGSSYDINLTSTIIDQGDDEDANDNE